MSLARLGIGATAARGAIARPAAAAAAFTPSLVLLRPLSPVPSFCLIRSTTTITASPPPATAATATAPLISQRLRRPIAPHLSAYDRSQIWFGASAWERITGCIMSGVLYGYASAYVVAPALGWHLESASLAAGFGALPFVVKGLAKSMVGWGFAFHAFNGVRHLVWDLAPRAAFTKANIKITGWAIWGASLVTGLGLGYLY